MTNNQTNDHTNTKGYQKDLIIILFIIGVIVPFSIGLVVFTEPTEARFPINNFTAIDDDATINPSSQNIEVTGTTQCTKGEIVRVSIRVEQDDVEAVGQTRERCLGEERIFHWSIRAATHGPSAFEMDENAHVWAEAKTYSNGKVTDFHDWDEEVNIIERNR